MMQAVHAGNRLCDCYGLVKGFVWLQPDGSFLYNAAQDVNTEGAFHRATEKGPLSTMPDVLGVILWMHGHVAVYIGNGEYIELAGGGVGANLGRVQGSQFTHWFKDTIINYVNQSGKPEEPDEVEYPFDLKYIQRLAELGIMQSPEYWIKKIKDVRYLNLLFQRFCEYLDGLK